MKFNSLSNLLAEMAAHVPTRSQLADPVIDASWPTRKEAGIEDSPSTAAWKREVGDPETAIEMARIYSKSADTLHQALHNHANERPQWVVISEESKLPLFDDSVSGEGMAILLHIGDWGRKLFAELTKYVREREGAKDDLSRIQSGKNMDLGSFFCTSTNLSFSKNMDRALTIGFDSSQIEVFLKKQNIRYAIQSPSAAPDIPNFPELVPATAPNQQVVSGNDDYKFLATSTDVVAAFSQYGLTKNKIKNGSYKWINSAKRMKGVGGRGRPKDAMFCPYQLMLGVIQHVRSKTKMSEKRGWDILQGKFPAAYEKFKDKDPREFD